MLILVQRANLVLPVSKKFKISNFNLESEIDLDSLLYKKNLPIIKKYFPKFGDRIKIEDHKILIDYKKKYI